MMTSPHGAGPGCLAAPGPSPDNSASRWLSGLFSASFANDNHAPHRFERPAGAKAVLLCREVDEAGDPFVSLRLAMDGEAFRPLLYVTYHAEDVIALWRGVGRDLNLPIAVQDEVGVISFVTLAPGDLSFARRYGSPLTGRRPRVLRRRQPPIKAFVLRGKRQAVEIAP